MKRAAALLTAVSLAAFAMACGQRPAHGGARPDEFTYYVQGTSPARVMVAAYPKVGGPGAPRPRFALYGPEGRLLWRVEADAANILTGEAGVALAVWTPHTDATGCWGTASLCTIAGSGRTTALGTWPQASAEALFIGGGRTIYAVADHAATRIYVASGARTATLRLELPGPIQSYDASADGSRLALILPGMQSSERTLVWATVSADGRPQLCGAPALVANHCVALSGDGTRAVLGGPSPVLVSFGQERGQRLPIAYVSEAWVGRDRVFLLRYWTVNSSDYERGVLVDDRGRALWQVQVSGPGGVIYADPTARYTTYRRVSGGVWRLFDLRSGREKTLSSAYADVCPLSTGGFLAVDRRGRVVVGTSPLGPSR